MSAANGSSGSCAKPVSLVVPQYGQIRNDLAAIGERHPQIGGDPARITPGPERPKRPERGGVRSGKTSGIGKIRQQP